MPLPDGWTATVSRFERNTSQLPHAWDIELQVTSGNGTSFPVSGSIPVTQLARGMNARQIVMAAWPLMRDYAMNHIAGLGQPTTIPPRASILGQVVDLP